MGQQAQSQQQNITNTQTQNNPGNILPSQTYNTMVNKNSGQILNNLTNQQQPQNQFPKPEVRREGKKVISWSDLREAFRKHQVDGYLNRERFNETILSILKFDIPVMSYTYLAERLFDLLDDSSDGRIQEEEFIAGMKNVFSSQEMREKLTFMAMMRKKNIKNTTIDPSEVFEYFFNSWLYGFRILADNIQKDKSEFLQKGLPTPNRNQFESFAAGFESKIKSFVADDLKESGIDPTQKINFESFKRWLWKDNTLQICYGHKGINIAVSLLVLDEVGFFDNSQQVGQYPSFK